MIFHVYQDQAGEWRWRLQARNQRIVADSAEGYATRDGCCRAVWRLVQACADGDTPLVFD